MNASRPLLATLLLAAASACGSGDDGNGGGTVAPGEDAASTTAEPTISDPDRDDPGPTSQPPVTVPDTSTASEPQSFPPLDLPLLADSELAIGEPDLLALSGGDGFLFAVRPPSVLLRIDPASGDVARLDLGLGGSRSGPPSPAVIGDSVWVLGGPFRDTLVEVDAASMTEVQRITLGEDHSIRPQEPGDHLWLGTFRGARPLDTSTGELGEVVPFEVDARWLTFADDHVWATLPSAAQVARVDPIDGTIELIDTEPGPEAIVVHQGVAWVSHPPTGAISRIDSATGEVLGVTDVDIGGDEASVTNIAGLQVEDGSVWAFLTFGGTRYGGVVVRLDPQTGEVLGARTIQLIGNTWEAANDVVWFHRKENGSIVAADVARFDDGDPTPLGDLAPPTTPPETTAPTTTPTADEDSVAAAFERFVDPNMPSVDLELGPLAAVRDSLLELLTAQPDGEARLVAATVDGDTGIATWDVVIQGDTVLMPGVEFVFVRRPGAATWSITEASLCSVAEGVGVPCP